MFGKINTVLFCMCLSTFLFVKGFSDECVFEELCVDHEQCCGGCCFNGECIDTYRSCLSWFDVCSGHVCDEEESCIPYAPPQCAGCEPLPLCQDPDDIDLII